MKFIPLQSFESINSLLQAVEAQGCILNIRLEAFTCRHTREEKQIASDIAMNLNSLHTTPVISPVPVVAAAAGTFAADAMPPLVLGSTAEGPYTPTQPVHAEDIDERLVYLVAALNCLYCDDGYDFSVLTESDFVALQEAHVKNEVQLYLQSLPDVCGPAVQHFWPAIEEQVLDGAQGCEYYQFSSPSDPMAGNSVFSHHFFLYNKRKKVLVSLLIYAEGNMYRGDDGYMPVETLQYARDEDTEDSARYASSPEPEDAEWVGKNRDFYGY
ncbi:hypothetical protein STCU_01115 [Strigomonas culicis]|uniref:Repressor of RNA polymerase III transcription n=1 Tax=Strigomonas culicis TaxID=28005 RepID=S9VVW7_9TRYP|nr:hypothetical protein STCU_08046 [Strigomonas culicis]EPY31121.1 hypothetical protein STCU_03612 [Strigomonas culicis]EPY32126.1 hypothetical protein STCU_02963 [Strigomonas culicis]EPY35559.1 hypothetical protein STCU_01115 [Strigomonas culicis]|eukprot:EPY22913.1 hypothetical protein STCU_08046 [Strigomonas culicis]